MGSENTLYYGDNLDVLRRYIQDETVDLIYLDPPFKSNADYNILFKEHSGNQSAAQIKAFEDTWSWDANAEEAFYEASYSAPDRVFQTVKALREILGSSDMMAYLVMMTLRLIELHRVLKSTGSLYLHCDPTASHYLKVILDAIFGVQHFQNEVIWKRTSTHSSSRRWAPVHDSILFYSKSSSFTWNRVVIPYSEEFLKKYYRNEDERGKFTLSDLTGSGRREGDSGKPWRNIDPDSKGRHWAISSNLPSWVSLPDDFDSLTAQDKLEAFDAAGLIAWPPTGGTPRLKKYLKDDDGIVISDIVSDIGPISSHAAERLGYPTQKPIELLERILRASSNEGDIILDPFCGCGTAVVAAQKLNRRWIGIDITHLAVNLIRTRMVESFGEDAKFKVVGEPTDLMSAMTLAEEDRYQFQFWALGLVNARPAASNQKKGADGGIDGKIHFRDDMSGNIKTIIISVKSGKTSVTHIRELISVVDREKAVIGVYITLQEPTSNMGVEALEAGYYESEAFGAFPKIQILTIKQLLEGAKIKYPSQLQRVDETFKKSSKFKSITQQGTLGL